VASGVRDDDKVRVGLDLLADHPRRYGSDPELTEDYVKDLWDEDF